ncbi:MAG: bifunctional YncE family protein/alkaline phosphatase family protein [Planctomycetota bacterium]
MRFDVLATLAVLAVLGACASTERDEPSLPEPTSDRVGAQGGGAFATPVNQVLTPLGRLVELPGSRPTVLAYTPDGRSLVTSGKSHDLVVIDPATGEVTERVPLPNDARRDPSKEAVSAQELEPDTSGQASCTGLVFTPDGSQLLLSNVDGSIKVFEVRADGSIRPSHVVALPRANAPRRGAEVPSGLAVSDDGARLYVCGNLSNRLIEIDLASGRTLRTFDVGVAPYDVVLVGGRAFVSNWGGGRPEEGDVVGPAGRGTVVRVDPETFVADEGSVSVVDLASGDVREVETGLHASALAVSPDREWVVCANAASDTLSVIAADSLEVVATISVRATPAELLQASPNALAFSADGGTLFVAIGTQNAVGVVEFEPEEGEFELEGLLPVGWFPSALALDEERGVLAVANLKGLGPGRERKDGGREFNTHQYHGSVSLVPLDELERLDEHSAVVDANLRRPAIEHALLPPRPGVAPRPVPERIGEPSVIRHVVYVIKENRTYDQVLGDLPEGNGDPRLCVFGERITPNLHALARRYVLLDNTYCAGILSADGHQWSTTAFATDYMEKSFAGFPRSYPDGMGEDEADALAYAPSGFLWDAARRAGLSIRNYGEFTGPKVRWKDATRGGRPSHADCLAAWRAGALDGGGDVVFESEPSIESIRDFTPSGYVGWSMEVPDQFRADFFLRELAEYERRGEYPALVIVCLPNDHTSGTGAGAPTPAAHVADNDLALGRIVEGLSRSSFWPETAVFVIEDDPQAGWDHVSGYRTTAFVASPWARRGAVVSTQYNTTSVLRTIEQILGLPPMNAFDASATPMFDCFTDEPDVEPYTALPMNVSIDEVNPDPSAIADPVLRDDALASAALDLAEVDRAPEDLLNRILWRAMRGTGEPYPEWAAGTDDD